MPVIGLTGNLASGKSTVLKLLKGKGAVTFDADRKIHAYYGNRRSKVYRKVKNLFPRAVRGGRLCRKKLGQIVFSDRKKLKRLEQIVHPVITKELLIWVKAKRDSKRIYVAEVPLLFEKKLQGYFDKVILVKAKPEVIIGRIVKKYNFSKGEALNRLSLYLPVREKIKVSSFIIDNSSSRKRLEKEVDLLWKKLKEK